MREIKFRGKTFTLPANEAHEQIDGRWFYGYFIKGNKDHCYIKESLKAEGFWVSPETVGQFTGLLDKNGKEIYEGDVLQMWLDDAVEKEGGYFHRMYVVFTVEKGFVLWGERMTIEDAEPLFEMLQWKDSEVVGNIHDNPELIR